MGKYRNLGIRATQRAEGINHVFKRLLKTDSPLVDLFHALHSMTNSHEEMREFMEFEMRDKQKVYHPLISSLVGHVSNYLLDLMELECTKMRWIIIGATGDDHFFSDSHKFLKTWL